MTGPRCLAAAAAFVLVVVGGGRAEGQGRPGRPPGQRPPPARGDTVRKSDSITVKDTIGKANFVEPDSVMRRLLSTPGYTITRYQGEGITFDAITRGIQLTNKAIVQRGDSQVVKSDTITYSGQGSRVQVCSTPTGRNVFAAPGQAPVVSSRCGTYDITNKRAAVSNASTSVPQSGETLFITGDRIVVVAGSDSVHNANDATYYLRDGTITACDDSIPDYYFKASEIKRTGSFVVARPAILYIGDVPVMWLPFLFQDIRGGRHSGILSPNFGVADIVRNSPTYRRSVEGLGYYWAISDFIDTEAWLDWRSSAGDIQPGDIGGFTRYNGEFRYRWLERYVTGSFAASHTLEGDQRNTSITWGHQEQFTRNSSLTMNLNYASNDRVQRLTTVNPYSVLSTIRSTASYNQKVGPMNFTLGGTRTQYPGRTQVDQTFPTVNMTTSPLSIGSWLVWTPAVNYSSHQLTGIDQPSSLSLLPHDSTTAAGKDSIFTDTLRRNAYDSNLDIQTPLQIFGYNLGNSFTITSHRNDFPEAEIVTGVNTGVSEQRVYSTTYGTEINWTPAFTLPPVARNNFNLTPSVSLGNVDPSAFWIRNERTAGQWVHQSKRPTFSLSASPTLFGLFDGFGPFTRIRHSITPVIGYSYAPRGNVSDEFLAALGRSKIGANGQPTGYLGGLQSNMLTFQLSTNIEGKVRAVNDSNPEAGEKLKLLSLNFSPLSYDIDRARATHQSIRGLTTESFQYTATSDLLPGFNLNVGYSLFKGSALSDTAIFSPFRTNISAGFSFSNTANPFAVFQRIFGQAVPPDAASTDQLQAPGDDRYAREVASQPVAGRSSRNAAFLPTVVKGWQASVTFQSTRQRPVTGSNVIQFDPTIVCAPFHTPALQIAYEECLVSQRANPTITVPVTSGLVGAPIYVTPNTSNLTGNLNFNVTDHWSASWNTSYDLEHHAFGIQIVSLQRDLHDWRAIFAFTQSPTGSFAFNFLISLKAEPDLKFDYHKSTYKNPGF